jgi:hypothetical protein
MGILYHNTGNVGIGTNAPQYALDVHGDIRIGGNVTQAGGTVGLQIGSSTTYKYLQLLNLNAASGLKCGGLLVSDDPLFASPSRNDLVVKGSVGIGVASPTATLDVNGTIKATSLELTGKATSASTVSSDSGTTLVTKDYISQLSFGSSMVMYSSRPSIAITIPTAGATGVFQLMATGAHPTTPTNAKMVFGMWDITTGASNALRMYAGSVNAFITISSSTGSTGQQFALTQSTGYKYNMFSYVGLTFTTGTSLGFYYNFDNGSGFANPSGVNFVPFGYIT